MRKPPFKFTKPLLSVVIPTLNEADNIRATIAAVLANASNFPHFEIVVADSGSEDATELEVAKAEIDAATAGVRLQLVKVLGKKGPATARNTGVTKARGKQLFFLDADTTIDPNFLRENLARIQTHQLAAAGVYMRPDSKKLIDTLLVGTLNKVLRLVQYTRKAAAFGAALFVERKVFRQMGGFDRDIGFGEDIDLIQRMVKAGHYFRMLPSSVITSARRAEEHGRWHLLKQVMRLGWHLFRHKTTKGSGIEYQFGHYQKTKKK